MNKCEYACVCVCVCLSLSFFLSLLSSFYFSLSRVYSFPFTCRQKGTSSTQNEGDWTYFTSTQTYPAFAAHLNPTRTGLSVLFINWNIWTIRACICRSLTIHFVRLQQNERETKGSPLSTDQGEDNFLFRSSASFPFLRGGHTNLCPDRAQVATLYTLIYISLRPSLKTRSAYWIYLERYGANCNVVRTHFPWFRRDNDGYSLAIWSMSARYLAQSYKTLTRSRT